MRCAIVEVVGSGGKGHPSATVTLEPFAADGLGDLIVVALNGARTHRRMIMREDAVVLGRGAAADMVIDAPSLSRRHAELRCGSAGVTLTDLGSSNGTFVGGRRLSKGRSVPLSIRQPARLGSVVVVVVREDDPAGVVPTGADAFFEPAFAHAHRDEVVLIVGEAGAGKRRAAATIHRNSVRRAKPLVFVDCERSAAAMERTLYGNQTACGVLDEASGGTIVLRTVDRFPRGALGLLHDLIERRRGSARILALSQLTSAAMSRLGRLDRSLIHQLSSRVLEVPPLRERMEELQPAAEAFLRAIADERGGPIPEVDPPVWARLQSHPWPGNFTELRSVLKAAVDRCGTDPLRVEHLTMLGAQQPVDGERERIERALRECAGNQTHAARMLGISRRTLLNRLDEYGIARPRKRSL